MSFGGPVLYVLKTRGSYLRTVSHPAININGMFMGQPCKCVLMTPKNIHRLQIHVQYDKDEI
ncbi:hypothetical protein OUZ56_003503 [Daphnia magna]|uniref:Uncharacterized protein n=1 Tax=Daphnia magna TaxID=35525 RepID=A0ABR0A8Z1_9CRUS|nr:hypothetical protein OUZ56_003503 [Daphnia magna]